MNTLKKTYGVIGLMEWYPIFRCGKAQIKIPFTGGALTGYGVTPAEFTTENPMLQAIIENSEHFKVGKIFVRRQVDGSGKYDELLPKEATLENGEQRIENCDAVVETAVAEAGAVADEAEAEGVAEVEVSDIDDAREYLVEEFGVNKSSLRSKAAVERTAKEHGIVFKGLE